MNEKAVLPVNEKQRRNQQKMNFPMGARLIFDYNKWGYAS